MFFSSFQLHSEQHPPAPRHRWMVSNLISFILQSAALFKTKIGTWHRIPFYYSVPFFLLPNQNNYIHLSGKCKCTIKCSSFFLTCFFFALWIRVRLQGGNELRARLVVLSISLHPPDELIFSQIRRNAFQAHLLGRKTWLNPSAPLSLHSSHSSALMGCFPFFILYHSVRFGYQCLRYFSAPVVLVTINTLLYWDK